MPVVTGDTALLPKEIVEDYGKIVKGGIVQVVGVVSKYAMNSLQKVYSINLWIREYPTEDPQFFKNSIYVVVMYEDQSLTYIPVEIFKKYADEYHTQPTGFLT